MCQSWKYELIFPFSYHGSFGSWQGLYLQTQTTMEHREKRIQIYGPGRIKTNDPREKYDFF